MSNARPSIGATVAVLAGVAAVLLLAIGRDDDARAQAEAALAVDCEGNTVQIDTTCQFGATQEFLVSVHVTGTPREYAGEQVQLRWDPSLLDYLPTDRPADEAVWPDCTLPLRLDKRQDDPSNTSVLYGCINFTGSTDEPVIPTTYTGPIVAFRMRCLAPGTSDLRLDPYQASTLGSDLLDAAGIPLRAELSSATVSCGGADVVRPDPEVTVGVDARFEEETPEGPSNSGTTPTDGETARPSDGSPTPTPGDDGETPADGDDDGDGFPVWGWILIVVVVLGGLGAAGAGWMRYRSSRTAT